MYQLMVCALLATVAMAQYNHHQPQQYQQPQQQQQQYQQPQQYQAQNNQPQKPLVLANVHYASIGDKLQGDYKYGYEAGDGAFRHEVRNPDGSVSGSYGYVDGDGQKRVVKYTAGKHGFSAEGDGVPQPAAATQPASQAPAQQYAPQQSYQPARQQYQAPAQQYQAPAQQYQPAPQQYQAPAQQYQAPAQQYQAPAQQYQAPAQQYQPQQYRQSSNIVAPSDGTYNPAYNTQGHWNPNKWGAVPYATGSRSSNHLG